MIRPRRKRRGVTLLELLVVLLLLSLMSGLALVAFGRLKPRESVDRITSLSNQVTAVRSAALKSGRSVTITLVDSDQTSSITAGPDGSLIADDRVKHTLRLDLLPGRIGVFSPQVSRGTAH